MIDLLNDKTGANKQPRQLEKRFYDFKNNVQSNLSWNLSSMKFEYLCRKTFDSHMRKSLFLTADRVSSEILIIKTIDQMIRWKRDKGE